MLAGNRNLSLGHQTTCPWQKQNLEKSEYKTLPLSVFSRCPQISLCDYHRLSEWPKTFPVPQTWTEVQYQNKEAKP